MIIDVVDYSKSGRIDPDRHWSHDDLASANPPTVITVLLPTDTLESFVTRVLNACRGHGRMHLLRVHGHGNVGRFLHGTLTIRSVQENGQLLGRLREWFLPRGQAYLMGCHVGDNPQMLKDLAQIWRVPVTAGLGIQLSIGRATFAFEGDTLTAMPVRQGSSQTSHVYLNRRGIPRRSRRGELPPGVTRPPVRLPRRVPFRLQ